MASEDSDQLCSRFLAIHRLSDFSDVGQTLKREVMASINELYATRELLEVALLRRSHRMPTKKRNDRLDQIRSTPDDVAKQVLAVVVVPLVSQYLTNPEEALDLAEAGHALCALRDRELVSHLVAGSVARSARRTLLVDETDREASFSVYKTNNPA